MNPNPNKTNDCDDSPMGEELEYLEGLLGGLRQAQAAKASAASKGSCSVRVGGSQYANGLFRESCLNVSF